MFDEFITFQARQQPEAVAVLTPTESASFAKLDADVNRFAGRLCEAGLTPGSVATVELANPYVHWLVLLALARLGVASAPADDTVPAIRITDSGSDPVPGTIHASPEWVAGTLQRQASRIPSARRRPDALGRVQLTSGTTGSRKRIGLTWTLIDAAIRNATIAYGAPSHGRWLTLTSTTTTLGFALPLVAWATGNAVILGAGADLSAGMLGRLQPTLIALVPARLQELLAALPDGFQPLPVLRLVTGGGGVPPTLAQQVRLRLAPELRSVYGASECGAMAIADGMLLQRHPGAAGYALPGVEIEVVDDAGRVLPAGVQGEVRIRSDRVVGQYLDDTVQSASRFRDGWFHPGDIGRLAEDGLLIIDGRTDELMNLGGNKVLPNLVEQIALGCPGVVDAAAFAMPTASGVDRCWLALVPGEGFHPDKLARQIQGQASWLSLEWVLLDAIPRNGMGKIDRERLRHAVLGRATEGVRR